MQKYYISLALILTIWFLYLDREESPKDTHIEPKKKEQNITKEQNLTKAIKISTPIPIKEENKTKQQEEVGELKYCLDEVIDLDRLGKKRRSFYDYHGDILEIKVDKNLDGKIDFSNHREFNENGDLLLEERDFDNDGEIDTKTDYLYNSWDRLEEVEIKAYMKSREEPVVLKVNINYSDEEEIDDSKEGREDIYQLLKSYTHSMILDMNIDIEYHEKYDEEGKKILAYIGNKDYIRKSFRYEYDDEGNLWSKTLIDYEFEQQNSTTYYTPSGKIKEIYTHPYKEMKKIINNEYRCIAKKMDKENIDSLNEIIRRQCSKLTYNELNQKIFHKELSKAYRYNENGTIAEEFNKDEQNITYKYDAYGNLIEKRRGDKILLKQKFKVCE